MLGNVQLFSKSHDAHLYSFFYIYGRNKKEVGTGGVIKNKKRIHRTMRCSETKKTLRNRIGSARNGETKEMGRGGRGGGSQKTSKALLLTKKAQ